MILTANALKTLLDELSSQHTDECIDLLNAKLLVLDDYFECCIASRFFLSKINKFLE